MHVIDVRIAQVSNHRYSYLKLTPVIAHPRDRTPMGHFQIGLGLFIKAKPGDHSNEKEFHLRENEISLRLTLRKRHKVIQKWTISTGNQIISSWF